LAPHTSKFVSKIGHGFHAAQECTYNGQPNRMRNMEKSVALHGWVHGTGNIPLEPTIYNIHQLSALGDAKKKEHVIFSLLPSKESVESLKKIPGETFCSSKMSQP